MHGKSKHTKMNQPNARQSALAIILPTPLQAILAFLISLFLMLNLQRHALLLHFAAGQALAPVASHQFNLQIAYVLGLSLVGQAAIIIFWSIIGLGSYLIVWFINNAFINARNEVIINTSFVNKGRHRFHPLSLAEKLIALIATIASIATLPYGLNAWLRLWQELLNGPFTWHALALALGSVIGFSCELYLSFMFFQFMIDRFRH